MSLLTSMLAVTAEFGTAAWFAEIAQIVAAAAIAGVGAFFLGKIAIDGLIMIVRKGWSLLRSAR